MFGFVEFILGSWVYLAVAGVAGRMTYLKYNWKTKMKFDYDRYGDRVSNTGRIDYAASRLQRQLMAGGVGLVWPFAWFFAILGYKAETKLEKTQRVEAEEKKAHDDRMLELQRLREVEERLGIKSLPAADEESKGPLSGKIIQGRK